MYSMTRAQSPSLPEKRSGVPSSTEWSDTGCGACRSGDVDETRCSYLVTRLTSRQVTCQLPGRLVLHQRAISFSCFAARAFSPTKARAKLEAL